MSTHRSRWAGPALAAALALSGSGLSACAGQDGDNPLAPSAPVQLPDIRGAEDLDDAYSGVLDAAFREDLDAYDGIEVTLLAEVISPRVFTVTSPDDAGVEPALVVATAEAGGPAPEAGTPLLLAATPVDGFDAAVVAEELRLDLDEEAVEEWDGETFLVATIVEPAP